MPTIPMRFSSIPVRRQQAGLSLIELMISLTIGLLLLVGMLTLIVVQSRARAEIDKSSRQIENGRYALTILEDDIQHAGYDGEYSVVMTPLTAFPDPCVVDAVTLDAALAMPLQGYDAPAAVPTPLSACLPDANHVAGTDIPVVRRLTSDDSPVAVAGAVPGQPYVQTTPDAKITALGADTNPWHACSLHAQAKGWRNPSRSARLCRTYLLHQPMQRLCGRSDDMYRRCRPGAADSDPEAAGTDRYRRAAGFTIMSLLDGIRNLQLDYGVASGTGGAPSSGYTTAAAVADWTNGMAVQVSLLARTSFATKSS